MDNSYRSAALGIVHYTLIKLCIQKQEFISKVWSLKPDTPCIWRERQGQYTRAFVSPGEGGMAVVAARGEGSEGAERWRKVRATMAEGPLIVALVQTTAVAFHSITPNIVHNPPDGVLDIIYPSNFFLYIPC